MTVTKKVAEAKVGHLAHACADPAKCYGDGIRIGKTNHVARKVDVKSMLGDESSAAEVAAARPGNKALG